MNNSKILKVLPVTIQLKPPKFLIFVLFLFSCFNLAADRSHTGDLIIDGSEVFTIENEKFTQTGNIYVRDNGSLIIKNATLLMNINYHGEFIIGIYGNGNFEMSDSNMEVSIPDDCIDIDISGGSSTINIQNSDLSTGDTILIFHNYTGKAVIKNTNVYMFMFTFTSKGDWDVIFSNGIADNITFRFDENYKGNFSNLKPGYLESWNIDNGGQKLSINKATARAYTLACDGPSDVTMNNSEVGQFAICAPLSTIKLKSISSKIEQVCLHGIRDVKIKMWGLKTGYIDSWKLSDHSSGDPLPNVELIDSTVNRPWLVSGFGSNITVSDSEIDLRSYIENNTLTAINCYISDLMLYCTTNSTLNFKNTTIKYITVLVPPNSVEISGGITFTEDSELTCWRSPTQITRNFRIICRDEDGKGVKDVKLFLYNKLNNLEWSGYTNQNGYANFDIEFNDNNYLDNWTLSATHNNQSYLRIVELLTTTPLILEPPPKIYVDKTKLYYTCVAAISDYITGSQKLYINNIGNGTLNWSISTNKNWIICEPLSGVNSGTVTVSVDYGPLDSGIEIGEIIISDPSATNTPQTVMVYTEVMSSSVAPFGQYATPIDRSTVASSIPVTGWALDDIGVESVKIYRENRDSLVYIGDAVFVEGARPDVEQAFPYYPMNYKAGWGYMMLTNFLPNGGNGTFKIHAIATDVEGHQVTLGTKTIIVDNANAVKPFGAIDTPGQGGTASGSSFINWGWVLTPQPNNIPTNGSTINVYVDGVNLGHPTYNNYRADIASFFPGYANSNGAAGFFYIDTTAYENGVHTIQWTATDSGGDTDGIGSRYFTIQNTGSSTSQNQNTKQNVHLTGDINLSRLPVDHYGHFRVNTGYDKFKKPREIYPDDNGYLNIQVKELDRIEIHFSIPISNISPLPVGSTLDAQKGIFYWGLGPGFLGDYELVFVDARGFVRKVNISVTPK